jgi:hypothetical protein
MIASAAPTRSLLHVVDGRIVVERRRGGEWHRVQLQTRNSHPRGAKDLVGCANARGARAAAERSAASIPSSGG